MGLKCISAAHNYNSFTPTPSCHPYLALKSHRPSDAILGSLAEGLVQYAGMINNSLLTVTGILITFLIMKIQMFH